eukprot:419657_1
MIRKIIDKSNKISVNDSPYYASANTLLTFITEKKKFISTKEIQYIEQLIQRAIEFNPLTMHKINENECTKHYEPPIKTFNCEAQNGLLHYLYQKHYDTVDKPYRITSSKLSKDSADLEYFIDAPINWMVKTQKTKKQSFIAIHLEGIKIKLNRFTLKEYTFNLKKYDVIFEASYDGKEWLNIKTFGAHESNNNDKLLSWTVNNHQNSYFPDFRIYCTPKELGFCHLECCGLELYGDVVSMNQDMFDVFRE